jgi:hypothetical protein
MRKQIDRVFAAFEYNIVPIIVTILTCYVLFLPAQSREIHRAFAQRLATLQTLPMTPSSPELWSAITTSLYLLGGLIALSVLLWLACRENIPDADFPEGKAAVGARKLVSRGLAILPFLALSFGLYAASSADMTEIKDLLTKIKEANLQDAGGDPSSVHAIAVDWAEKIASYNVILKGSAVVFVLLGLLLVFLLSRFDHSKRADAIGRVMSNGYAALGAAVIFLGLCALYAIQSGAFATRISAVPILLVFAVLSLLVVNYLAVQSGGAGRLVLWLLATAVIVFSLSDFANNHRVRRIPYTAQASPQLPELTDTFLKWHSARMDQSKFSGSSYPIYIVAAQGGGIYAAMHAAHFLSYMQARCPNFAHHLFAISGVSGGSVGATAFAASMKEAEDRGAIKIPEAGCNPADNHGYDAGLSAAVEILDNDFWSPLEAMWLFPDVLQQFLPVRVEMFDRARALEHGLEASWQRSVSENELYGPRRDKTANTMAEPFISLWPQGFDKSLFTPALVLNTTEVNTGRRRLISPFRFEGLSDLQFFPISCKSASATHESKIESVPLSTAAVLSARFPWITPTAWFYMKWDAKTNSIDETNSIKDCVPAEKIVNKVSDGGYFESSGVATALDLAHSLQSIITERGLNVDIKLVILTSGGFGSDTTDGLDEALDPIRTLLNASEARGYIEIGRAERADFARAATQSGAVLKLKLEEKGYPLPLGWSLSDVTRFLIQFQTGEVNSCESKQGPRQAPQNLELNTSSCVISFIATQLTHR